MLNPAETAQAVSNSMEHKAHTPLVSIIFLAIMAVAAIGGLLVAHRGRGDRDGRYFLGALDRGHG